MTRRAFAMAALLGPLLGIFQSGCTGWFSGLEDLEAFVARDQGPPEPINPLPPLPVQPVLIYRANEYADPFDRNNLGGSVAAEPAPVSADDAAGPDRSRPREPLEAYPLDQLEWVGLVETGEAGKTRWALISDPGGRVYRVTRGHYIGRDFGRIEAITPVGIEIAEMRRLPGGNWINHGNTLSRR